MLEKIGLENRMDKRKKKVKVPKKIKVLYSVLAIVMVLVGSFGVLVVYGNSLLNKMTYDDPDETVFIQSEDIYNTEDYDPTLESFQESDVVFRTVDNGFKGRTEEGVYNILLLGEDHTDDETYRGNTDVIMVATIDTNSHQVKLTTFMRDIYVYIPGYSENKLNSVYAKGGIELLYETFSANFDLDLDGYFLVNFDSFEAIVDELGGVDITLDWEEANYLNTTNYISIESERNVVVGEQHMTGSQALGYARIRYVGNSDYERTERQRNLLTSIFNEFKNKNMLEMTSILDKVFPMVKTDLKSRDILTIATKALSSNLKDIETYRIPVDDTFSGGTIKDMSVLIIDFNENIRFAHEFIFGDDYYETKDQPSEDKEVDEVFEE